MQQKKSIHLDALVDKHVLEGVTSLYRGGEKPAENDASVNVLSQDRAITIPQTNFLQGINMEPMEDKLCLQNRYKLSKFLAKI